ncbi:MAG: dephospho-CoA kinase [Tenuifilaceae bacterium]|jgi:dephospho-CoA kinase|nr:dephospho-CoA kinase [Tenuifilaceae bacterium]
MLRVGITGGIGSGKSTVCKIVEAMGYPVYSADHWARELTNTNPTIVDGVKQLFGENVYTNNELNRKQVGQMVFADKLLLQQLNAIIHPVVANHFEQWVRARSRHRLVFKEAAILFESGAYRQVDKTVAVWAPDELRVQRVVNRDGITPGEVRQRMANQMQQDELVKRADFVINNVDNELLTTQLVSLIDNLLRL